MLDPILWSKLKKTIQLDASGTIPSEYWPSGIDDVQEFETFENLPIPGIADIIYVVTAQNLAYRWDETLKQYFLIGTGTSCTPYTAGEGISIVDNKISLTEVVLQQLEEIQATLAVLKDPDDQEQSAAEVLETLVADTAELKAASSQNTDAVTWGLFD